MVPLLGVYPKGLNTGTQILEHHCSLAPLFAVARSASNLKAVYAYDGMLFSFKKEGKFDTCYNMDKPLKHYDEWNNPSKKTKRQILNDFTFMMYLEW